MNIDPLTFAEFRQANVHRCTTVFHELDKWSETDWGCALTGETGELCNLLKKRHRWLQGMPNPNEKAPPTEEECAKEAGDIVAYLDLLCARMGIDLGSAVLRSSTRSARGWVASRRPWLIPGFSSERTP